MGFNDFHGKHMQFCPPNCPKRHPGCQDSCGTYKANRAKYDERMAIENKDRDARQYTCYTAACFADATAKTRRAFGGAKWPRGWRR